MPRHRKADGVKPELLLDGRVSLWAGGCLEAMAGLAANSIDSCVTDPPYHLQSIVKRFGAKNAAPAKSKKTGVYSRSSIGFMGKKWDGGDVAFRVKTWQKVYRVMKPGAYLVAFSGTRTYHRMACAIEDAGFVVYDMIDWMYGQGFPKSVNIALEFETTLCERRDTGDGRSAWFYRDDGAPMRREPPFRHADANEWYGYGTALKPSKEPICLARKPLSEKTIAANVKRWGTGALNIDGCRVPSEGGTPRQGEASQERRYAENGSTNFAALPGPRGGDPAGRWPANVVHDGSPEVINMFPAEAGAFAAVRGTEPSNSTVNVYGERDRTANFHHGDSGSAARFFYSAKADSADRIGSAHPTVKPVDLMQWLVRLVTPKGGITLDPFAGTGTTGEAAWREGLRAILIEQEPEYQADIRRRMALCMAGPEERARASMKAKLAGKPEDHGPLFSSLLG